MMSAIYAITRQQETVSNPWKSALRRHSGSALVLASVLGLLLFATSSRADAPAACTITGTAGADVLRGTAGDDVICGLGGNDMISGKAGNDVIRGGVGNDRIWGDTGNDTIAGETGNDSINSGTGNDGVTGGTGNDYLNGITGNDVIQGGTGSDRIWGGIGNDALEGESGTDQIYTGTGSDTCAPDSADRVSGSCTTDRTGPAAAWIDLPSTVTAGETFTASFSLKDPSSIDPNSPNVKIGGAPGWITSWCGDAGSFPLMASLTSGSIAHGVWSVTCQVPANAVNDSYSLFISAQDSFANSSDSPSANFRVVGGSSDNGAPVITDVVIPTSVKRGETITLTWRAADPSGVKDTPYPWVYRPGAPWGVLYGDYVEAPVRTSGDAFDGAYSQTLTLPANSVDGTYPVYISVRDELGNKTYQYYGSFTVN